MADTTTESIYSWFMEWATDWTVRHRTGHEEQEKEKERREREREKGGCRPEQKVKKSYGCGTFQTFFDVPVKEKQTHDGKEQQ